MPTRTSVLLPTCSLFCSSHILCYLPASFFYSCSLSPVQRAPLTHPLILLSILLSFFLSLALWLPPLFLLEFSSLCLTVTIPALILLKLLLSSPEGFAFHWFHAWQIALPIVGFFCILFCPGILRRHQHLSSGLFLLLISTTCLYAFFPHLRYHPEAPPLSCGMLCSIL